jgi:hypothetical protein
MATYYYNNFTPITKKDIPPGTIELVLHDDFNNWIYSLPSSVKYIKFGKFFNRPIGTNPDDRTKCYLHKNIIAIKFGEYYNQESNDLPKYLHTLIFGWFFNQVIKSLPANLGYLEFGYNFNQELDNLPPNLKYLTIGYSFDKWLGSIPDSVIHLTIYNNNEKILNSIPPFIEELELNHLITDKKIDNFPFCLKKLIVKNCNGKYIMNKIPFGCEIVYI